MKKPRDIRYCVRFSAEEMRRFAKLAESLHTDLSVVIRQALHEKADALKVKAA
jgi:predicted transcriptional regulator